MAGKIANVLWLEGSFVETLKGWQAGWFYITEPRDPKWVAAPRVQIRTPHAAHVLERDRPVVGQRGRSDWVANMHLVPGEQANPACQHSPGHAHSPDPPVPRTGFTLWEFDPAQHQTLSRLFDTTYEDVWKVLTKGAESPTSASEDRGYSSQRNAGEVSYPYL